MQYPPGDDPDIEIDKEDMHLFLCTLQTNEEYFGDQGLPVPVEKLRTPSSFL